MGAGLFLLVGDLGIDAKKVQLVAGEEGALGRAVQVLKCKD